MRITTPRSFTVARALVLTAAWLLVWSPLAKAWGLDGHRVVGEIAWLKLEAGTKERVREFLPQGRYHTLSEASVWADSHARSRKQYDWVEPLHYIVVDPSAAHVVVDSINCPEGNCVIEAINRFARVLEDPAEGRDAKIEALRLLAHFVGDVHQPLHVSFADGCGGCTVQLQTPGGKMTLHELWDTGVLEQDLIRRYEPETELSDEEMMHQDVTPRWRLLARELVKETIDPDDMSAPRTVIVESLQLDGRAWAEESLQLSRSPLFRVSGSISDGYLDEAIPIVEARLRQAGFRLAAILNEAFSGRRTFSKGTP